MSYIAVDIGATKLRVGRGSTSGLEATLVSPTPVEGGAEAIPRQIISMIEALGVSRPQGVGIGSIGPLDLSQGAIGETPNFPHNHIPLVEPLREHLGSPVTLVNDCSAAVVGEKVYGAGRGLENLVYITMSTGLGGGAIVDGHLLMGKDGNAVEVGHLAVEPRSQILCGCGGRGHWEAFCGGRNIPRFAAHLLSQTNWGEGPLHKATGGDPSKIDPPKLFQAAEEGDPYAQMVVQEIGWRNAVGVANTVNAYDPELITLGGSIALNHPRLILDPILRGVEEYTINRVPEIRITPLGHEAVLLGALALAQEPSWVEG